MFLKPSPEHYKTHTTNKQYYTEKVWRRFSNWRQQYSSLRFSVWSKERPRDDIIAVKCTRHNSRMYFYDWKCVSGLKWSQKDIPAVSDKEKSRHRHRVSETCQLSKSSSLVPPILKYHIQQLSLQQLSNNNQSAARTSCRRRRMALIFGSVSLLPRHHSIAQWIIVTLLKLVNN